MMRKRFVGIQSLTGKNWLGTHIRKHHVHDRHFEKKVRDANYGEELSEAEKDARVASPQQKPQRQQDERPPRAFIAQVTREVTIFNVVHIFGNFLGICYIREFIAQVTLRPHFATTATLLALTGQSHCSLGASFYKPHQLNPYLSRRDDVDIEWDLVPRSGTQY